MNAKTSLRIATNDVSAGEIPETDTSALTMIVCALLIAVCFAAPLLLTLPQTMDAVASSRPVWSDIGVSEAAAATFHERHPVQAGTDWYDSLEEAEVAQWRMRASD